MREMQDAGVFGLFSKQNLLAELCRALLRSGHFRLAKAYLQVCRQPHPHDLCGSRFAVCCRRFTSVDQLDPTPIFDCLQSTGSIQLPRDIADQIVISASRDYSYNATSLTAPAIRQAQQCLEALPDSAAATAELHVIQALLQMHRDYGFSMLPSALKEVCMCSLHQQPKSLHAVRILLRPAPPEAGLLPPLNIPRATQTS